MFYSQDLDLFIYLFLVTYCDRLGPAAKAPGSPGPLHKHNNKQVRRLKTQNWLKTKNLVAWVSQNPTWAAVVVLPPITVVQWDATNAVGDGEHGNVGLVHQGGGVRRLAVHAGGVEGGSVLAPHTFLHCFSCLVHWQTKRTGNERKRHYYYLVVFRNCKATAAGAAFIATPLWWPLSPAGGANSLSTSSGSRNVWFTPSGHKPYPFQHLSVSPYLSALIYIKKKKKKETKKQPEPT